MGQIVHRLSATFCGTSSHRIWINFFVQTKETKTIHMRGETSKSDRLKPSYKLLKSRTHWKTTWFFTILMSIHCRRPTPSCCVHTWDPTHLCTSVSDLDSGGVGTLRLYTSHCQCKNIIQKNLRKCTPVQKNLEESMKKEEEKEEDFCINFTGLRRCGNFDAVHLTLSM